MKVAIPWLIIVELIRAIGCPIAKTQCPNIFKKEDCDAVLNAIC